MKRVYKPLEPLTSYREALDILKTGDEDELIRLAVRAGMYLENWREAQDICIRLLENDNPRIRRNAVMGLSYVAVNFGKLDKRIVKPYLLRELRENAEFREDIQMYIDDINWCMRWKIGEKPIVSVKSKN